MTAKLVKAGWKAAKEGRNA